MAEDKETLVDVSDEIKKDVESQNAYDVPDVAEVEVVDYGNC